MAEALRVAFLALLATGGAVVLAQPDRWEAADVSPWSTPRAGVGGGASANRAVDEPLNPASRRVHTTAPGLSPVVSVHELEHPVPKQARSEYEKARKARLKRDHAMAIEHLARAISIDPGFYEAFNDLGVNYMDTNQFQLAAEQFNKGIEIAPRRSLAYTNLALAFIMQDKFEDAERAARQAIDADRGGMNGKLMLGASLVLQHKYTAEAEQNLKKAATDLPQASLLLAPVLVARGDVPSARDHLERYLASGDIPGVALAKRWMQMIDESSPKIAGSISSNTGSR